MAGDDSLVVHCPVCGSKVDAVCPQSEFAYYRLVMCNNCSNHFFVRFSHSEGSYSLTIRCVWNRNKFKSLKSRVS